MGKLIDVNQIVEQVTSHIQDAPEMIKDLIADPQGTIEQITGQGLEGVDPAEIIEQVQSKLGESGIDVEGIIGGITENLGRITESLGGAVSGIIGGLFNK